MLYDSGLKNYYDGPLIKSLFVKKSESLDLYKQDRTLFAGFLGPTKKI